MSEVKIKVIGTFIIIVVFSLLIVLNNIYYGIKIKRAREKMQKLGRELGLNEQ